VDDEEAVALAVGLLRAAQEATAGDNEGGIAEAAARALAKVSQVMPARLRRRAEAVAAVTEAATWDVSRGVNVAIDPDVLAGTALACRDAERIRFGYVAASGERTERHAEPHRLVALERRWYLVAYDLSRQDWRSFRLDRIAGAVQPTGARFRARELPAASAAEFVRRNITSPAPTYVVEAVVSAPAAVVRGRIGRWGTVTEQGADHCLVTMTPPEGTDWAIIALGMTGADFRVLSPAALVDQVGDWAGRFARAAAAGPG
jgi:predicted DNA-binding transcriptional regulator YafY